MSAKRLLPTPLRLALRRVKAAWNALRGDEILSFQRVDEWPADLANSWAGAAATRRFKAGIAGADFHEGVWDENGELTPIALDQLEMLANVHLQEARVLDFGCGGGAYYRLLAEHTPTRNWMYVGADTNASIIAECRQRFRGIRFETVADGRRLPFADGEFDVVIASGVLQYCRSPSATLAEITRVGRAWVLVSRVPVRTRAQSAIYIQRVKHAWGREVHVSHIFNREDLERLIAGAGLSVVSASYGAEAFSIAEEIEAAIHMQFLLAKR